MTHEEANNLVIICNSCGKPMRCLGEWPVQHPKSDMHQFNLHQAFRWHCYECKVPNESSSTGYVPVGLAVLDIVERPKEAA